MAIRYGYPKGHEDVEALAEVILAERLTARELPNSYMDDAELLNAMKPRAAAILASDWLASHDAALIEQARAEGKAEADAAWVAKVEALAAVPYGSPDWGVLVDGVRHLPGPSLRALIPADAATTLDEVRAQAKAEGLREWIAEWPTTPDDGTFLWTVARDGLARADRIGGAL